MEGRIEGGGGGGRRIKGGVDGRRKGLGWVGWCRTMMWNEWEEA